MDKELKKIINEILNGFFDKEPEKIVERGIREIYYDICPHCKKEIYEKHDYTEDNGLTWRHSDCKGLINRPDTPLDEINTWLRPYVEEARKEREEARKMLGLENQTDVCGSGDLPPSGEEKYNKQEPGGTMAAVNID